MNTGSLKMVCVAVMATSACLSRADDWPQWRHDANHSAVTSEQLPAKLKQQWQLALGKPAPAYEHQTRMCADFSYAPVAAEGLLFVPSNVSDQVMAFDLKTGGLKWRAVTEGPVRFAPVYDAGNVYFASDDGYLYCVSAQDGSLHWKVRGVPEAIPDRLMLVNGRMVSRWPARGAPVLHDGVVYFGVGIWPEEGAYQNAVDARTGKRIWQNDALSYVKDGMNDHGKNYDLSLPPHGYGAVINNKLAVASGRTLAAWFDLKTGELDPYTCFYVKAYVPRGSWYIAGNENLWVQGGNWFGAHAKAVPPKPDSMKDVPPPLEYSKKDPGAAQYVIENRPFLNSDRPIYYPKGQGAGQEHHFSDPVITETTSYAAVFDDKMKFFFHRGHTFVHTKKFDKIEARDLTRPVWKVLKKGTAMKGKTASAVVEFPVKWEMKTSLRVLAKAGNHLVAGEEGRIALIELPKKGGQPQIVWESEIEGDPVNTLVSNGHLVTVTDQGDVYCFGTGPTSKPKLPMVETREKSPANGFAFVAGWGDGAAVHELAKDPEWRVVVVEKDPAVVTQARQSLNKAGLNGRRVQVIQARPGLALTPYWASRVVMNDSTVLGDEASALKVALDVMRPFNGTMAVRAADQKAVAALIRGRADYALSGNTLARTAPPEGSADWSHETAGADNSFVSQDELVKWPLGVLWYSGDIDRFFTPETQYQHERNPYPLVQGGRMFLITYDTLHAIDVYTGDYLWGAKMPTTPFLNTRLMSTRLYGRPTERNYVLSDDIIYCVTGDEMVMYDVKTGKSVGNILVPKSLRSEAGTQASAVKSVVEKHSGRNMDIQSVPQWTEVRLEGDLLIGMVGQHLVVLDRRTGKMKWNRKTTQGATTYALGAGMLYGFDCDPDEYKMKTQVDKKGLLFCLNLKTGKEIWRSDYSYKSWPKVKVSGASAWIQPPMPLVGYNGKHQVLVVSYRGLSTAAFKAADGEKLWSKEEKPIKDPANVHSPNILDDHVMISLHGNGGMGYLVDIMTGAAMDDQIQVPKARTCGRLVGNEHLLTYRDAATRIYDIEKNITIPFNSMRAGCTTSFIPANGVMSAPMLGHGCVCNYPMFASMAMVHMPESDDWRPDEVKSSWKADAGEQAEKTKAGRKNRKKK